MKLSRTVIRHAVITIALAAVDFALIVQKASDPLAYVASMTTLAAVILSPAMLLLVFLAGDN